MALGPENARAKHNQNVVTGGQILDGLISCEEGRVFTTKQVEELRTAWEALKDYRIDGYARPHVNRLVEVVGRLLPANEPAETYECEFRCEDGIARTGVGVRCPACTAAMHARESAEPGEEQMTVKAFDIDAAVERVSEAVRAAFVEMQRLGLLGPTGAAESWPTWQDVPDGIWFTGNGLGPIVAHRKRGSLVDNRDRNGETIVLPDFLDATYPSGPFVPVEVDL